VVTDVSVRQPLGLSLEAARDILSNFISEYEAANGTLPYGEQAAGEAMFALEELAGEIAPGMRCLEVGAGTGLFTHLLASVGVRVDALEPIGSGFLQFRGPLAVVADKHKDGVRVINSRIEDFKPENCVDIAVSINVFEHVDDWREAIRRTVAALLPGGRAIILCPNYDVPYEPHFRLPVVGTKNRTFRLFRSHINAQELRRGSKGLWESLNFISGTEVRSFCRNEGIPCSFDKGILPRMFKRISTDPIFRGRRGALAPLLSAAERAGIPYLIEKLPLRMQPYLRIVVTRPFTSNGPRS
jgi:SAM-dependent methyltransferase